MVIKNLSRKDGTGQLVKYILRYITREKEKSVPDKRLKPYLKIARKHGTVKAFEKALKEQGIRIYHGTPEQNMHGSFGPGVYLAGSRAQAREQVLDVDVIQKYIIEPDTSLFDTGKKHEHYTALWQEVLGKTTTYTPLQEVNDQVISQLKEQGYVGIKDGKQVVLFDPQTAIALPKDFCKEARQQTAQKSHKNAEQAKLILQHNIRSKNIEGYIKEFEQNEANRIYKRKDNTTVHHTILSFSTLDKKQVTDTMLQDIARKYVELRGSNNLYVIASHHEKDHIHLHVAMSGCQVNGRSSRISKKDFEQLKLDMDAYQREKYPQLSHSLPEHGKAGREQQKAEIENIKRNERTTYRNEVLHCLETAYTHSTSREQFYTQIQAEGYELYYRSGRLTGIQLPGGMKFRLNRLGYDDKKLDTLEVKKAWQEKELADIENLRENKNKELTKDINEPDNDNTTTKEESELTELDDLRNESDQEREADSERDIEEESHTDRDEPDEDDRTDTDKDTKDDPDTDDENEI